jgi:hypothetical protein
MSRIFDSSCSKKKESLIPRWTESQCNFRPSPSLAKSLLVQIYCNHVTVLQINKIRWGVIPPLKCSKKICMSLFFLIKKTNSSVTWGTYSWSREWRWCSEYCRNKNRKVGALAFDESRLPGESHPTRTSMRWEGRWLRAECARWWHRGGGVCLRTTWVELMEWRQVDFCEQLLKSFQSMVARPNNCGA